MEQILVVKSRKKDVLVKNVGPTLFQSPTGEAPTMGQLFNAVKPKRIPNWIPKIGGKKLGGGVGTSGNPLTGGQRLAAGLGLLGKVGALAQTTNQVAQQAQAGNPLGAVLGAGYTYEANDPTGKRTARVIQGQPQQLPPSTVAHQNTVGAQPNTTMGSSNVVPLSANYQYNVQNPQTTPVNVPSSLPQTTAPQAPQAPVGPVPGDTQARVDALNAKVNRMNQFDPALKPQPVQQTTPAPATPAQQSMVQQPVADGTLNPYFNMNVLDEHNNSNQITRAEFFASTLMEKLGADTVYKMSPHQVAALSAYTFLKLS